MSTLPSWAFIVLGYALGSIPFGLLLTKAAGLGDIRAIGSGNIGATNVLRTGRRGLAAATLLLDAAKGAGAVLLAASLAGVATGLGVLLTASWPVGLIACAVWLAVARLLRISSAGALAAFACAPVAAWALGEWPLALFAVVIALLVFIRHEPNIRRMLAGTEPKIGSKR
jgi:glycerol-3-phosphate acyltransferase PlsY